MNKSLITTLISILVFAFAATGLYMLNKDEQQTIQNSDNNVVVSEVNDMPVEVSSDTPEQKLIIGEPSARVTITEFADYKCPNCNRFHRGVEQEIFENYQDDQVNIEVVITPIIGPDSGRAGRGAYCANEQNLFVEYHTNVMSYMWDNFYSSGNFASEFEDILTTDNLVQINLGSGLDSESFISCIESDKYNPTLDQNLLDAADNSVRGTPGFVISGQSFVGLQPLSVFTALIDRNL